MNTAVESTNASWRERADKCLMPAYGARELTLVRGDGTEVWDAEGRRYLDFVQGIAANNLGHCHPVVVEAIRRQSEVLMHTSNIFLNEPSVELAELLAATTGLTKAMFMNSGTEATESAIKLARYWARKKFGPAKHTILTFTGSFHGRTYAAMSGTWDDKVREGFDPLAPGFRFVELNDLEDLDAKWDDTVCAVMIETVQGQGGIRPASDDFMRALRQRCTERRACFVVDEVQCGMARSGKPFAYMYSGVTPDVLVMAKALGGGFPIGAIMGGGEFADAFAKGSHGTTFGANPLACAAAIASCNELFDEGLLAQCRELGSHFWTKLDRIVEAHPDVCDHVRGRGLMLGLVLKVPALDVAPFFRKAGLLTAPTAKVVVRLLPPLVVTREQLDEAAAMIEAGIVEYERWRWRDSIG